MSNFDMFIQYINSKFNGVFYPRKHGKTLTGLGLPDLKLEGYSIPHDGESQIYKFEYFHTTPYDRPNDAKIDLIAKIEKWVDEHFKNDSLIFWRTVPVIREFEDFRTGIKEYFGLARIAIIPDKNKDKHVLN